MQLQRRAKAEQPGQVGQTGKQHRQPSGGHGVLLDLPAGVRRRKALAQHGQKSLQQRRVAHQPQQDVPVVIIGEKVERLAALPEQKILPVAGVGLGQHLAQGLNVVGKQQAGDIALSNAVAACQVLEEHFGPQFRLMVKGWYIPGAVVAETGPAGSSQHPNHAGAADLDGLNAHLLDFPGAIKSGRSRVAKSGGGERAGLVIPEQRDPRFVDRGVYLGDPMQPKPPDRLGFDAVGVGAAGQVESKTAGGRCQQPVFGRGCQPIAPEPVPVHGAEKSVCFETSHDLFGVGCTADQAADRTCRVLAGKGGQGKEVVGPGAGRGKLHLFFHVFWFQKVNCTGEVSGFGAKYPRRGGQKPHHGGDDDV